MSFPLGMLYSFGVCHGPSTVACCSCCSRVSSEAFERLEPCEGKLSRTVLRGLGGSNLARLLDRGWFLFGAKPAQSETPARAAAERRSPGRAKWKQSAEPRLQVENGF